MSTVFLHTVLVHTSQWQLQLWLLPLERIVFGEKCLLFIQSKSVTCQGGWSWTASMVIDWGGFLFPWGMEMSSSVRGKENSLCIYRIREMWLISLISDVNAENHHKLKRMSEGMHRGKGVHQGLPLSGNYSIKCKHHTLIFFIYKHMCGLPDFIKINKCIIIGSNVSQNILTLRIKSKRNWIVSFHVFE